MHDIFVIQNRVISVNTPAKTFFLTTAYFVTPQSPHPKQYKKIAGSLNFKTSHLFNLMRHRGLEPKDTI